MLQFKNLIQNTIKKTTNSGVIQQRLLSSASAIQGEYTIVEVKELVGHSAVATTQRYITYNEKSAAAVMRLI